MNLTTAKPEITNARLAARVTAGTIGPPPVSPSVVTLALAVAVGLEAHGDSGAASSTTYDDGVYDRTNRVDHKLRILLMYVVAAVRIRNVLGARHLAHKIGPGVHNSLKEVLCELLRYVSRHLSGIDERRKVIRFILGEHDKGHRLQRSLVGG